MPDFTSVAALLDKSVESGQELGAGLSVWQDGHEVLNTVAGARNAAGDPWQLDTLVMTYSTAKPFAALAALTAVADGAIGLDQPIAEVWPEYAAHGKGRTTLRHVLSHQAGMYVFPEEALSIDALDTEALIDSLARAVPLHQPGEGAGEHALTYGHLLDGVVRRATGETLNDRFGALARENGWDLHLSVAEHDLSRVADLDYLEPGWPESHLGDPVTQMGAVLSRPAGVLDVDLVNSRAWRTGSFPAISLHATASAIAGFYAHVLDEDGPVARRLGPELHREYTALQVSGTDLVLGFDIGWTLGFQRDSIEIGMGGVGGSAAWLNLDRGQAVAFVTRGLKDHDRVDVISDELDRLFLHNP
jgi:CubicO group peptidase (beta-lactamase class C family)